MDEKSRAYAKVCTLRGCLTITTNLSHTDRSQSMYTPRSSDDSYQSQTLRQVKVCTYRCHMTINVISHILRVSTSCEWLTYILSQSWSVSNCVIYFMINIKCFFSSTRSNVSFKLRAFQIRVRNFCLRRTANSNFQYYGYQLTWTDTRFLTPTVHHYPPSIFKEVRRSVIMYTVCYPQTV
jgi:hypothetical protein